VRYTVRGVALHVIQHGELWPRDVHRRADTDVAWATIFLISSCAM
jgi:hypothetical protein